MVLSMLMMALTWLIKVAAKGAVDAVSMSLSMLIKMIEAVPPEEYAKLAMVLESFLASLVARLGPNHPAVKVLSPTK